MRKNEPQILFGHESAILVAVSIELIFSLLQIIKISFPILFYYLTMRLFQNRNFPIAFTQIKTERISASLQQETRQEI